MFAPVADHGLVMVWDDGDEMTPGPQIAPQSLTLKALGAFAESLPEEISRIEAEVRPS